MDNPIINQLKSVDWNFYAKMKGAYKTLHWYPGTFPSDIPTTLIQAITKKGDIVIDPYSGIGTTVIEAMRLGRVGYSFDVNKIGNLATYSSAALILLKSYYPQSYISIFGRIYELINNLNSTTNSSKEIPFSEIEYVIDQRLEGLLYPTPSLFIERCISKPKWELIEEWVEKSTLDIIKKMYFKSESESIIIRIIILSMISSNIRTLCSQNKSWGHIADNVKPKELIKKDVLKKFNSWLSRIKKNIDSLDLSSIDKSCSKEKVFINEINWSDLNISKSLPKDFADVIITSPPYANAIDYVASQRLSYYILGYSVEQVKAEFKNEIGARKKRFNKQATDNWANELNYALVSQLRLLKKKAIVVYVLPHKDHGRDIGFQTIKTTLEEEGFHSILTVDRSIDQTQTRQSWTSIHKETIIIYERI